MAKKDFLKGILENIIVNYDYAEKVHRLKINFKLPVIIENFRGSNKSSKSSKTHANQRDQIVSVGTYSTVKGSLTDRVKTTENKSYSFRMSVDFISSNLWNPPYSDYQHFLYQTIVDFHKQGWTYLQISNWLNKENHLTPRGKKFKATHVWNIHVKKQKSIERFSREYNPTISKMNVDVVDV